MRAALHLANYPAPLCPLQPFNGVHPEEPCWLRQVKMSVSHLRGIDGRLGVVGFHFLDTARSWRQDVVGGTSKPADGWTWEAYCGAFHRKFDPLGIRHAPKKDPVSLKQGRRPLKVYT